MEIGRNVCIYQQVTLGKNKERFPVVGNNVVIYAGAKVLGNVVVGNNSVIGANAVVLNSVNDDSVAVGVPARVLEKKDV